jgi:glycosyltransferase involved in cell wall biosynthesis
VYVDIGDRSYSGNALSTIVSALELPWLAQPDVLRRVTSTALWPRLQELPLEDFDAIHVETMAMAPFALAITTRLPHIRTVLDLPDVASQFNARLLKPSTWLTPAGVQGMLDLARLNAFERRLMPQIDAIVTCSQLDAQRLRSKVRPSQVQVLPNCTTTTVNLLPASDGHELVFVGTMSYPPNEEGVLFFCDHVLPAIRSHVPDVTLTIVGKTPSAAIRSLEARFGHIKVTGEVDDVRPYLARAAVAVVPLLSGGGTRLKILEAMAAGRAIVSTSIGAEGLELQNGRDLLLADSPSDFAAACVALLHDVGRRRGLESSGRQAVVEKYDWRVSREGLKELYRRLPVRARSEPKAAALARKA